MSIILQLIIGILLIFMGRYNVTKEHHAEKANRLNNFVVLGVFLITVVNVFISAFGIEPMDGMDPEMIRSAMDAIRADKLTA